RAGGARRRAARPGPGLTLPAFGRAIPLRHRPSGPHLALVSHNVRADVVRGAIVARDRRRIVTGDLGKGCGEKYANLTIAAVACVRSRQARGSRLLDAASRS